MSSPQKIGLRKSCDDCPVFVSCLEGKERDEVVIAELQATQLMREAYLDESEASSDDERARRLKQYQFGLWVMEHETYKGDPAAFVAALEERRQQSAANIHPFQTAPGVSIFEQIITESTTLYRANIRNKYRNRLLDAVQAHGCEGPRRKRSGFLGRQVMMVCQAPLTQTDRNLAANPPFNDSIE